MRKLVWPIWLKTVSYRKLTFEERFHIFYMNESLFWKIEEKIKKYYLGKYEQ